MLNGLTGGDIVAYLVAIIISMSIHEAMHAYASHALGDTTAQEMGRLSLNPLRHIDPFTTVLLPIMTLILFQVPVLAAKPVPFNPDRVKYDEFGSAIVAAAGPLSNLLMAVIVAILATHIGFTGFVQDFLVRFVQVNVLLLVFNSLPIPPLDGSRVLYAFAPEPVQDFMRWIEPYGLFVIFALVLSGALMPLLVNLNDSILQHLP